VTAYEVARLDDIPGLADPEQADLQATDGHQQCADETGAEGANAAMR
jgi:hypothetical protein